MLSKGEVTAAAFEEREGVLKIIAKQRIVGKHVNPIADGVHFVLSKRAHTSKLILTLIDKVRVLHEFAALGSDGAVKGNDFVTVRFLELFFKRKLVERVKFLNDGH